MDQKPGERWDLAEFLTSLGMSEEEAKAWIEARKKGRSLKKESSDTFGERLDKILERNKDVIYTVDTILHKTILTNSYSAHSTQRII